MKSRDKPKMKYLWLGILLLALFGVQGSVDALPIKESLKLNCVQTCDCTSFISICNVTSARDYPGLYLSTTKNLIIKGTNLGHLKASHLRSKGLKNLEILDLSNCQLTSIDENAFQGFPHLQRLDLSLNNIAGLTANHFANLNELHYINISGSDYNACHKLAKQLRASSKVRVICGVRQDGTNPTTIPTPNPSPNPTTTTSTTMNSSSTMSMTPFITVSASNSNDLQPVTEAPIEDKGLGGVEIAAISIGAIAIVIIIVAIIDFRFFGFLSKLKARHEVGSETKSLNPKQDHEEKQNSNTNVHANTVQEN